MNIALGLSTQEASLRAKIKAYKKVAREIQDYLASHPDEWGKFQSDFNIELNGIFRDIMNFEKNSLARGDEESVYKLKRIFVNHLRQDFLYGDYIVWSLKKPYGYPGDFKIIDDIYRNNPQTTGFDRLFDNYFQMSAICNAVRNRKEDFKKVILNFILERQCKEVLIMDLASGPCRDVHELLCHDKLETASVNYHCYDNDEQSIDYARRLLQDDHRVVFFKESAVRIALKKDVQQAIDRQYDLIFSTGLFDYLDFRVSVRLVSNLKKLLKPDGIMVISDVRNKFSNPSIYFMEWVADWNLVYRDDLNFLQIFNEAGFPETNLRHQYEQQGIMQYVSAFNNRIQ